MLGAGFGGLELTTRLSEELGDDVEVVLIDQADGFVFGFSKLDVMFGRTTAGRGAATPYRDVVKPGVRFVQTDHPRRSTRRAKRVETDAGAFDADVLVVALGADLAPGGDARAGRGRPRVLHGGRARSRCATCSPSFDGGRVIVGVTSTPFKCPPAPSETALLMHDFLTERGLRDAVRDLAGHAARRPDPAVARRRRRRCSPRSPSAASTGIPSGWCARSTRPARSPCSPTATRCPTTCSSACPCTGRPRSSRSPGMCVDGWIPVDPLTLETRVPRRVRGRRRDQRRHAEGRRVRRGPGRRRGRARSSPGTASARDVGDVRRPRHLLPRVRPRPGRQGRRHLPHRAGAVRRRSRPVARCSRPTRPSSARAASGAGSAASGVRTELVVRPPALT